MNTAGRLLSIFNRLVGTARPTDVSMVKVWAEVFELPKDSPHLEDDVVTCLQSMRSEMALLRSKLQALGAPENLMHPGFARLYDVCSTAYINQAWNGLREQASKPENRLSFEWANWALRDDSEEEMPAEELAALRSEIDSLEASLHETEMTPYLRGFIQRQIDAIRAALRVYRVQGVKPIEEALHQVAGAYTIEKSRVEAEHAQASEPAKTIFARAGAAIKKTAEIADSLDKIRKAGEGAYTLAATVGPLLVTWVKS
ncbi:MULTISPECIES: hypothetical protein [unclassified Acidovorax]|uniref:hypothetical protein n=1 Tax=unclassified Acidovorax TaxID=2684926 RepID=UPI000C3B8FFF|nr:MULTISPECIES: hypothetical protein [unclassified Acidovorax]PIF18168.1 hypothetical protein CLU87_2106 [Acidovorax sp. 59]PKW02806.1 hypothetical protein CLU89_2457 [Acidovorax sp. 30]